MKEFILELARRGIHLKAVGKNIEVSDPRNELTQEFVSRIRENKSVILTLLNSGNGKIDYQSIPLADKKDHYILSSAQKRLYFLYELDRKSLTYNMPFIAELEGELDRSKLEEVFKKLIIRHEILRTKYVSIDGEVVQQISENPNFELTHLEAKDRPVETIIDNFIRPFDLSQVPLLRVGLIRVSEKSHILMVDMHHIVTDGVSHSILVRDFMSLYAGKNLPVQTLQYKDYAVWQQSEDQLLKLGKQRDFWSKEFSEPVTVLDLPTDFPRPRVKSDRGSSLDFSTTKEDTAKLRSLSEQSGATMFMTVLSVFNILLSKLSNQEEIVVGTPVAGRPHPDLRGIMGMFVNTLVLRNHVNGNLDFNAFLTDLKKRSLLRLDNQSYQYEALIEDLQIARDTSRNPLFDVRFVFQKYEDEALRIPGLLLRPYARNRNISKFDLMLVASEAKDQMHFDLQYSTDLFSEATIRRFIAYFNCVVKEVITDPTKKISEIDILSADERHQLLNTFNDTSVNYPSGKNIIDLFREQVSVNPGKTAVVYQTEKLTFKELDEHSDHLSYRLRSMNVVSNVVALCLEPSLGMIIGIIGILKSGMSFLPLDPNHGLRRLEDILEESNCDVLITDGKLKDRMSFRGQKVLLNDSSHERKITQGVTAKIESSDLAYVMFTSGSTGRPKGVRITHRNIVNYANWFKNFVGLTNRDKSILTSSYSFDLGYTAIFPVLLTGGELHLVQSDLYKTPNQLRDYIINNGITYLKVTPSLFSTFSLVENFFSDVSSSLRFIVLGGESIKPTHIEKALLSSSSLRFINHYGPTETTIGSVAQHIERDSFKRFASRPTIGRPINNTQCYILNSDYKLVPVGVTGELYIGGHGLSLGYLNDASLTRSKFIPNPFKGNDIIYKTGDVARWLPDGRIEYLGRTDDQIKIRGYRVSLAEIERQLSAHKHIKGSVVLVRDNNENKYLVAYYVSEKEIDTAEIKRLLSEKLPDYMVPSHYVHLDQIPMTPNGKVDRNSLPLPDFGKADGYVAPRTREEKILCEVWSDVLGIERVGVTDNFFSIGGDSIRSIQICARMKRVGYKLTVKDILTSQTIEVLSWHLKQQETKANEHEVVTGEVALTGIQRRFFARNLKHRHHYNQSVMLNFSGGIQEKEVRDIFSQLQCQHDALRMRYQVKGTIVKQENIGLDYPLSVTVRDLTKHTSAEMELLTLCNSLQAGIDLETGPLMKLGLFHMVDGSRLLIVIHHLVVDGISWRILFEDIETLFQQARSGKSFQLPAKTDSFQNWSNRLLDYISSKAYVKAVNYWTKALSHSSPAEIGPHNSVNMLKDVATVGFRLSTIMTRKLLNEAHGAFNTQINDLLLAGFLLCVKRYHGWHSIKLDLEGHGREEIFDNVDLSRTVGWFTNIHPVVLEYNGSDENLNGLIKEVKEALRAVPNNGIDYLIGKYIDTNVPLANLSSDNAHMLFNYLGQFDRDIEDKAFTIAPESTGNNVSIDEARDYDWEISGRLTAGQLGMDLSYNKRQYDDDVIKGLMVCYEESLNNLINYCSGYGKVALTPSDLSYKGLTIPQLESLQASHDVEDIYPLSPMQQGMMFHSLVEEDADHFFEQISYRLKGKLDVALVEKSFRALVERHDILRTLFVYDGYERPLQIVLKDRTLDFRYIDVRAQVSESVREDVLEGYRLADRARRFVLRSDVLMRISVYRTGDDEYEFIWSSHHILMDGWCRALIINEFSALYSAYQEGKAIRLPVVPRYSNYINWLEKKNKEESLQYWKRYLAGYENLSSIPKHGSISRAPGEEYLDSILLLNESQTADLEKACRSYGVTFNTVIQGIWGILLSRYNNTNDVVFGAVVSGRPAEIEGVERMIGLFINTVPVRVTYNPCESITDLFKKVQQNAIEGEPHYYHSLAEIQMANDLGMDLLDHVIVFENYPIAKEVEKILSGSDSAPYSVTGVKVFGQNNYGLSLTVVPGDETKIRFDYDPSSYESCTIDLLKKRFSRIVDQVKTDCEVAISSIDILSAEERNQLLFDFNDTSVDYSLDKTIIDLFRAWVEESPDSIAVMDQSTALSYKELNARSNQLAAELLSRELSFEDPVLVLCERSVDMLTGMLGILTAGAAYVPLSPEYPLKRIAEILRDTGSKFLLTSSKLLSEDLLRALDQIPAQPHIICLDDKSVWQTRATTPPAVMVKPHHLAYIIYTSGSTGRPKGVMIEHAGMLNHLLAKRDELGLNSSSVIAQTASATFDISIWQFFSALIVGGQTVVYSKDLVLDPSRLLDQVYKDKVTILEVVPSYLTVLINQLKRSEVALLGKLKYLVVTGESLQKSLVSSWFELYPNVKMVNAYGPTEASDDITHYIMSTVPEDDIVPVGKALPNLKVYIVDDSLGLCPLGVKGEIVVSGVGVGRGYLNQPDITATVFINDPFSTAGERLYKTGDIGYWLPDGSIAFLGRRDDQVKIKGHRIELGEIERQMVMHEAVREATVLLKEKGGEKYLVGYYVSPEALSTSYLREYLSEMLPPYMVPSYFVSLERMPLTGHGKINKQALPDPEIDNRENYVAPRTNEEKLLCEVWSGVLGMEKISITDNFFALGGDSIKSIQIRSRVLQAGYDLSVKDIFANQTIETLSLTLKETARVSDQSIVTGPVDLTGIQRRFFNGPIQSKHHYNQSVMLNFAEGIDEVSVGKIFTELQRHHDSLRMVYKRNGEDVSQYNNGIDHPLSLVTHDLAGAPSADARLLKLCDEIQGGINLEEGPLMKLGLFHMNDGSRLLVVIHHLVVDGISWRILFEDLETLYHQVKKQERMVLPKKTDSFQRWSSGAQAYMQGDSYKRASRYWSDRLQRSGAILKRDHEEGRNTYGDVESISFELSAAATSRLLTEVPHTFHTQIEDILLSGLAESVCKHYGSNSIRLDLEGHGREEILDMDTSRTIGWFTSVYPVVLEPPKDGSRSQLIKTVKEALRGVPNKGMDYLMARFLDKASFGALNSSTDSRIKFNYWGQFDNTSETRAFSINMGSTGRNVAMDDNREYDWIFSARVLADRLEMTLAYSAQQYTRTTIVSFMELYKTRLEELIDYCCTYGKQELTPSDLTYKGLTIAQLEELQKIC